MTIMRVRTEQVKGTSDKYKDFNDQLRVMSESYQEVMAPMNGQTVFKLDRGYTLGYKALKVYLNGTLQTGGNGYEETDAFTVTFKEPLYNTDIVVFIVEGGGSGTTFVSDHAHVYNEKPTGSIDGMNVEYVIESAGNRKIVENSQQVFLNGVRMAPEDDYVMDVNKITFYTPPLMGDKVLVDYIYHLR